MARRAARLQRGGAAQRAGLAAGQADRPAGLGRAPVPSGPVRLLGMPGPAAACQLSGRRLPAREEWPRRGGRAGPQAARAAFVMSMQNVAALIGGLVAAQAIDKCARNEDVPSYPMVIALY